MAVNEQLRPRLREAVQSASTTDEVSLPAQCLGYEVSGSDLLRSSGQSSAGIRLRRIDHPGDYPGRYD